MNDLVKMVSDLKGCQFASMVYENDAKCKKIVEKELGKVTKLVEIKNIQVGADYESAVNRRIVKAGGQPVFESKSLPWGKWVDGQVDKLIEHNGQLYLRYYEVANTTQTVTYKVNGVEATSAQVKFIEENLTADGKKTFSYSNRQAAFGLVDEDEQVTPRSINTDNIIEIKFNKQVYAAA